MSKLSMSREETISALRNQFGEQAAMAWEKANPEQRVAGGEAVDVQRAPISFPIRIVLPWSALCSDNRKYGAVLMGGKPKLIHTAEYRTAKQKARKVAHEAMTVDGVRVPPISRPLSLHARVFMPNKMVHDSCNFSKCAHDAFEHVVYDLDAWLHRVTWERGGVDVDAPRAEIEIAPL